jgi:predicted metal-binding membrane protein
VTVGRALSAVGLIQPTRRRGFCPACRFWDMGSDEEPGRAEISAPAVAALAFLALAAVAWALTIWRSRNAGMDMDMGMGMVSLGSFAAGWTVMMAAMMLPTTAPLAFEFARRSEGRRRWQVAIGVLAATYLGVWLAFGLVCYAVLRALPIPEARQGVVGAAALALAGLYGLTQIKASSEASCRELCSLHGPLPFGLVRSAMVTGARYGLSCLGCSAGLMIAMAVIGMSNLVWMVILAAGVLVYKLAPASSVRRTWLLSGALVAMAIAYLSMA